MINRRQFIGKSVVGIGSAILASQIPMSLTSRRSGRTPAQSLLHRGPPFLGGLRVSDRRGVVSAVDDRRTPEDHGCLFAWSRRSESRQTRHLRPLHPRECNTRRRPWKSRLDRKRLNEVIPACAPPSPARASTTRLRRANTPPACAARS